MNAILNTNRTSMPGELVSHAIKNYHQEDSSEKAIISALKEINATIKVETVLKQKTRNGGFVAWPSTAE